MEFSTLNLPKKFEKEYNVLLTSHLLTGASYVQKLEHYNISIHTANNIIIEKHLPSGKTRITIWRDGLLFREALEPLGYKTHHYNGHCLYLKQYWPKTSILEQEIKTICNGRYKEKKFYDEQGILVEHFFYDIKNEKQVGEYYKSDHGRPYSHTFIHNGEYYSITIAKICYKGGPWFSKKRN